MASGGCFADIGKHSESSPEVQVYRALQKEFLEGPQGKELFARLGATLCQPKSERRGDIYRLDSASSFSTITGAAADAYPCAQLIEGTPVCGQLEGPPYFQGPADSVWRLPMHGVAYATYVRELARRASIPPGEIEAELADIEEGTLASIQRTLSPSAAGPDSMRTRLVNNPATKELSLMVKWNAYVLALPDAQRATTPVLLSARPVWGQCYNSPGTEYLVRSVPPGAMIRIIQDFDWRLCGALKQDPWGDKCVGWTVVVAKRVLIGTYRYEAQWQDGKRSRQVLNVDGRTGDTLDLP
ncbi:MULTISPECIES: hypothetical protein [unclassified Variovorax]|uniref:hypothetical protein n=1 Tax=unclassified Variovorax TaxID=663243 RepID=UPI0008386CCE|nr:MULTISPECIES: hypothetical protein [unclassified Variovorax]PNG50199.1 hypothetical protein CHC06_05822 [Variovorax sp. B2]PNG51072.1 hypothetical protein CHC07_05728 [Variovorax sp. B4]VTU44189.1 hypothetical protein H6P1_00694 [Variovorax sp. PBL-H6]